MKMHAILLNPFSVCVGHENSQLAGAKCLGHCNLHCQLYLFTNGMPTQHSIVYRDKWYLQIAGTRERNRAHKM